MRMIDSKRENERREGTRVRGDERDMMRERL